MRITFAEFSRFTCVLLASCKALKAATMLSLMMSQHDLKYFPVKPSGPGALSTNISFIALRIPDYVNGVIKTRHFYQGGPHGRPVEILRSWLQLAHYLLEVLGNGKFLFCVLYCPSVVLTQSIDVFFFSFCVHSFWGERITCLRLLLWCWLHARHVSSFLILWPWGRVAFTLRPCETYTLMGQSYI